MAWSCSSRGGGARRRGPGRLVARRRAAAGGLAAALALLLVPGAAFAETPPETGGLLWAFGVTDTIMATPPVSFPPGADVVRVPPDPEDDFYSIDPTPVFDDMVTQAGAGAEAGLDLRELDVDPIVLFADCDTSAGASEATPVPAESGCDLTWTQAFRIESSGAGPVELILGWRVGSDTFVGQGVGEPDGVADVAWEIETSDGSIALSGSNESRRLGNGDAELPEIENATVLGDWALNQGTPGVLAEDSAVWTVPPDAVVGVTLHLEGGSLVPEGMLGDVASHSQLEIELTTEDDDVTITPVPVPEPGAGAAGAAVAGVLGALRAVRRRRA